MKRDTSHNTSFVNVTAITMAMITSPAVAHTSETVGFSHLLTGADHILVLVAIALVIRFLAQVVKPVK